MRIKTWPVTAQVHDNVVVTRAVAYWQRLVGWVRLHWRALLAKLPGHHQTRAEAAVTWLHDVWDTFRYLAGHVRTLRSVSPGQRSGLAVYVTQRVLYPYACGGCSA